MNPSLFSEKVKSYLKAAGYTQKMLASILGFDPTVLSHKLNGTGRTILTHPEIKEIVKTLASLEAISNQSQANNLLVIMGCPSFSIQDWQKSPLNKLEPDNSKSNFSYDVDTKTSNSIDNKKTSSVDHTNLPSQLTSFIGREQEIVEINHLLEKTRLLTLTGAGGVGKTRLSIEVVRKKAESFADGAWLVELASIEDPQLVPQVIATALEVRQPPGQPLLTTLTKYLQPKRLLILLDNCEHIIQSVAITAERLLRACPDLYIVATSREPLKVEGEIDWKVPFLSIPSFDTNIAFENLSDFEAVRLFIERAKAVRNDFEPTEIQTQIIGKICRDLDGLPLAIELAAARIISLSVEQIAHRLDNRFHFLTSGKRTSLPRHKTLKALVDWSYDLLADKEQQLLCELSIFAKGWTIEAAEVVCSFNKSDTDFTVFDLLTQLVEKSLIIKEGKKDQARYRMLETIRQYGQEKLRQTGKETLVREKHAKYYTKLLNDREISLQNGRPETLEETTYDLENIRSVWYWIIDNNWLSLISQSVTGLSFFYQYKGFFREGEEALYAALNHLRILDTSFQDDLAENRGGNTDNSFKNTLWNYRDSLAHVLIEIGAFLRENASFTQLCTYGEEAVELAHINKQPGLEGAALARVGSGLLWQGKLVEARAYLELGLQLSTTTDLPLIQADCLRQLGILCDIGEDYFKSIMYSRLAIDLYRKLGNRLWESASLNNLGEAYFQMGNYQEAKKYLTETFELATEIKFLQIQTLSSLNLGKINIFLGNIREAALYLEAALDMSHKAGNSRAEAETLCALSLLNQLHGTYQIAAELSQKALKITREQGNREYEGYALTYLGHALMGLRNLEEARKVYQEAGELRLSLGQKAKVLDPLSGLLDYAIAKPNNKLAQSSVLQILNTLEDKNWSLVGIADALRVYEKCKSFFAQKVNNIPKHYDIEINNFMGKFDKVAVELYRQRFSQSLKIGSLWYPHCFQQLVQEQILLGYD